MKRIFVKVLVLCLALFSVSCNKGLQVNEVSGDEISFILEGEFAATVQTKATEVVTSYFNSNPLKVIATTGSAGSESAAFTNVSFSKSGDVWVGGQYWPSSNPSYHFYASNVDLTHTASGATVSPANANTDIVVGRIASPTYKSSNAFTLEHIFCQLGTITMNAPANADITNLKVYLSPIVSGTYRLDGATSPFQGTWTTKGSASGTSYILGSAGAGVSISHGSSTTSDDNDLWLVPNAYTLTATYTETRGAYSDSRSVTATGVTLVQGKNNNITAQLPSDNSSEIQFTVTVTPWSDNSIGTVNFN